MTAPFPGDWSQLLPTILATFLGAGLALWTAAYVERQQVRREDSRDAAASRAALRQCLTVIKHELMWNLEVLRKNCQDARLANHLRGQVETRAWDAGSQQILASTEILQSSTSIFVAYASIRAFEMIKEEYLTQLAGPLNSQRMAREATLPTLLASPFEDHIAIALRAVEKDISALSS